MKKCTTNQFGVAAALIGVLMFGTPSLTDDSVERTSTLRIKDFGDTSALSQERWKQPDNGAVTGCVSDSDLGCQLNSLQRIYGIYAAGKGREEPVAVCMAGFRGENKKPSVICLP
ncbi:MAG: hypothetical protein H6862_00460 [Rhodospirillales bacterium]|nr:hypothetical protein [Rhodospirillales bacterium]